MALNLVNLSSEVRQRMLDEINDDLAKGRLSLSNRLSSTGQSDYPDLLKQAVSQYDDTWLATELQKPSRMNTHEPRKTPSGGTTMAKVPVTAHETLAEGEF